MTAPGSSTNFFVMYLMSKAGLKPADASYIGVGIGPSAVAAITERYPDLGSRFPPLAETLSTGVPQLSYTQWEAFLALYHCKILIICTPAVTPRHAPLNSLFAKRRSERAAVAAAVATDHPRCSSLHTLHTAA